MKLIVYNGSYGPQILAGSIPFTAGAPTEVADDVAPGLLAKHYFTETPAAKTKTTDHGA